MRYAYTNEVSPVTVGQALGIDPVLITVTQTQDPETGADEILIDVPGMLTQAQQATLNEMMQQMRARQ